MPDDGPVCIECGCTEHNACLTPDGPCWWVWVDDDADAGLCTAHQQKEHVSMNVLRTVELALEIADEAAVETLTMRMAAVNGTDSTWWRRLPTPPREALDDEEAAAAALDELDLDRALEYLEQRGLLEHRLDQGDGLLRPRWDLITLGAA